MEEDRRLKPRGMVDYRFDDDVIFLIILVVLLENAIKSQDSKLKIDNTSVEYCQA